MQLTGASGLRNVGLRGVNESPQLMRGPLDSGWRSVSVYRHGSDRSWTGLLRFVW